MDQSFESLRAPLHAAAAQSLALHELALGYARSQMKLVREQHVAAIGFAAAGFDAAGEFATNASKSVVAALAPETRP